MTVGELREILNTFHDNEQIAYRIPHSVYYPENLLPNSRIIKMACKMDFHRDGLALIIEPLPPEDVD